MAGGRLCVVGHPVAHSRSPAMHAAALRAVGLDDWTYEAIDILPERFAEAIGELAGRGYVGANVTIPHKEAALRVADDATPAAREIGAANTLRFGTRVEAENTDAPGLLWAIGDPVAGVRALVVGAGGAARACVWALLQEGAEVSVWNRTPERAERLAEELGGQAVSEVGDLSAFGLLVNTTAVGMDGVPDAPFKELPIDADALGAPQVVVDLAYRPGGTTLVRVARDRGARTIDGLEVLVRQGALSFRWWTGLEAPLGAMREAVRGG